MKNVLHAATLGALLAWPCLALAADGLLPNPSFEEMAEGRPAGFRVFPNPPEAQGDFYILDGTEGDTTHTGRRALQFHFPDGAELAQAAWIADAVRGGCEVRPGAYSCSFWIKTERMLPGFHVWVSLTGYGDGKQPVDKIARSEYLRFGQAHDGEWQKVEFNFDIKPEDGIQRVAPSVIFKTSPDALVEHVPPDTRILVDDLQIEAKP
jgi:hypothetical protein